MENITRCPIHKITWKSDFVDKYNESKVFENGEPVTRYINAKKDSKDNIILSVLQRNDEDDIVDKISFTYKYDEDAKNFKVVNNRNRLNKKMEKTLNRIFYENKYQIIQSLENKFNVMMNKVIDEKLSLAGVVTKINKVREPQHDDED